MKVIICLAALIAVALAAPAEDPSTATILRYENVNQGIDGYQFGFESSDGISREEVGQLKNVGTDEEALSVRGSFTFSTNTAEGGRITYTVTYTADENGYVPEFSESGVL